MFTFNILCDTCCATVVMNYGSGAISMCFSSVSILFWVCSFHATAPYSNVGLTSILYVASFSFGLAG